MTSNAQREMYPEISGDPEDLRSMAAARLAAHRSRRAAGDEDTGQVPAAATQPAISAAAQRVRDAVAARYRQTPSYREYLAAEAERAVNKAQAEVEVAARTAKAVADVQTQLLAELEQWPAPVPMAPRLIQPDLAQPTPAAMPMQEIPLQVRTYESLPPVAPPPAPEPTPSWVSEAAEAYQAEELQDLNQEIEFRLDPEFHEHLLEPLPLQANIIEFPRQLVAAKKARPRLAEGPLRSDEADLQYAAESTAAAPTATPAIPGSQLRIFEVEPEAQTAPEPEMVATVFDLPELAEVESPEWQRLILDARPEEDEAPSWVPAPVPEMPAAMKARLEAMATGRVEIYLAPIELRLMASAVDGICLTGAFLLFSSVAAAIASHELHHVALAVLGAASVLLFAMLFVLYQGLFFTLGKSTPGMYYADLAFRSLDDTEPTIGQLRRRIWANLLSVLPCGVGYLWAVLDKDGLGWQDRLSGTYLKEY
jgi:uncharacterized RDD family membrane protein YckC